MPAGEPESLRIGAVRPLPVDLDAGDGLVIAQDEPNDFLDLIGDLLDETKIEESRLRLLNTGYFKSVEFSLKRGSERGKVLLVVEVVALFLFHKKKLDDLQEQKDKNQQLLCHLERGAAADVIGARVGELHDEVIARALHLAGVAMPDHRCRMGRS